MPVGTYVSLPIRKTSNGSVVRLYCIKETADYYGWAEAFQRRDLIDGVAPGENPGFVLRNSWRGGEGYRISEHPDRHRKRPGKTHRFRLSTFARDRDLLAVLAATTKPWAWVEKPSGAVIHNRAFKAMGDD